jgi:hypothetical protein
MRSNTLTHKFAVVSVAVCGLMLAVGQIARANPQIMPPSISLAIGDAHELGLVNFVAPPASSDRLSYVNHLIGMALGSQDSLFGQHLTRSDNAFSQLPQAVLAGHVNGTGTAVNLGAGGLYSYLFASYNDPNHGSEVWYVGDLSGVIAIPATAGGYGLSGWILFGTNIPGVPDGGITAILLGTALGALGLARRFLSSQF